MHASPWPLTRSCRHPAWPLPPLAPGTQAEARQTQWEGSAVGKAAIKSVKAVKEERAQGRPQQDHTRDWLS